MTGPVRYAKGAAKEDEILQAALEVFAVRGPDATSLREIAEKVDLTPAGILHYFGTKDHLYTRILERRGQQDWERDGGEDGIEALARLAAHNSTVPGLVQLFMSLAVASSSATHPAHDFFRRHYETVRTILSEVIEKERKDGHLPTQLDPDRLAVTFIALADGLQLQWLLDQNIDMSEIILDLWKNLKQSSPAPESP